MAADRLNDLRDFLDFAGEQIAGGGADLTLEEALSLWEQQNAPESEQAETLRAIIERLYASIPELGGDETARRWYESYTSAVGRLRTMPLSCGLAREDPRFDEEIGHLLFGTRPKRRYQAPFTTRDDEVVILAVRSHGERPVEPGDLDPEVYAAETGGRSRRSRRRTHRLPHPPPGPPRTHRRPP